MDFHGNPKETFSMRHLLPLLTTAVLVLVAVPAFAAAPYYAPGSYQGWTNAQDAPELLDDGVAPDAAAGDGIYTVSVTITTAGAYEYKVAETDWAASWPGSGNSWFITSADNEVVTITFNENAQGDGWAPDSFWPMSSHTVGSTYTVVGDIGSQVGGNNWDPAGTLYMVDDGTGGDLVSGDGIYTFCSAVATAGTYEWKVAVNGDWAQQFGTDGPSINASTWFVTVDNDGDNWCFELDLNTGRIQARADGPVQIESSTWGTLKGLYR
jgi:hypothetical protein